jgi:hypothetical protein
MNRRSFFKVSAGSIAAIATIPTSISLLTEEPLYKQFDWLNWPSCILFRVEKSNGELSVKSIPVVVKTQKTKLTSKIDVDYTLETHREKNKVYYTNPLLLKAAAELGFTHLYCFVKSPPVVHPDGHLYVCYGVRGVKMPGWKTENGELKVVDV